MDSITFFNARKNDERDFYDVEKIIVHNGDSAIPYDTMGLLMDQPHAKSYEIITRDGHRTMLSNEWIPNHAN
jgi:hypothetical protein